MRKSRPLYLALVLMLGVGPVHAQSSVRLKIATVATEDMSFMQQARSAAEEIARRTDGRVRFRFYPGSTMGSDEMVLRKIRIGQLHGGMVLTGSLARTDPDVELYNLPLMFRSYDEVDHVRRNMDSLLIDVLDDQGLVSFGIVETGFVYLMSSKATRSFSDLEGRKVWVPEGDQIARAIVDAAGLSPVPLAISDVLTGLQTGLIDTVAAFPVGAVALQWFTKAKYVTDLPITYTYGTLVLGKRAFAKISPQDQIVVRELLGGMIVELDRHSRTDNQEAREALVKQGVAFLNPTEETRQRWAEVAVEATRLLIERQDYDPELLGTVQRLLEEYRSADRVAAVSD
jgi:TRAP-type C4-dicarboxylate transport system substrate-binding protein